MDLVIFGLGRLRLTWVKVRRGLGLEISFWARFDGELGTGNWAKF